MRNETIFNKYLKLYSDQNIYDFQCPSTCFKFRDEKTDDQISIICDQNLSEESNGNNSAKIILDDDIITAITMTIYNMNYLSLIQAVLIGLSAEVPRKNFFPNCNDGTGVLYRLLKESDFGQVVKCKSNLERLEEDMKKYMPYIRKHQEVYTTYGVIFGDINGISDTKRKEIQQIMLLIIGKETDVDFIDSGEYLDIPKGEYEIYIFQGLINLLDDWEGEEYDFWERYMWNDRKPY